MSHDPTNGVNTQYTSEKVKNSDHKNLISESKDEICYDSLRKKSFDKFMENSYSEKYIASCDENSIFSNSNTNKGKGNWRNSDIRRNMTKNSIPKRKQNHGYCANPNCNNPKSKRRKFLNKSYYYCNECTRIIDDQEYCRICFEISSAEPKKWVACDSCPSWVHVECEENSRNGIKNLSQKLGPDPENSKYIYLCFDCRVNSNMKEKSGINENPKLEPLPMKQRIIDQQQYVKSGWLKSQKPCRLSKIF